MSKSTNGGVSSSVTMPSSSTTIAEEEQLDSASALAVAFTNGTLKERERKFKVRLTVSQFFTSLSLENFLLFLEN